MKNDIDIFGNYPAEMRHGTFIVNRSCEMPLTVEILNKIPERNRPDPSATFFRTIIEKEFFKLAIRPDKKGYDSFFEIARFI